MSVSKLMKSSSLFVVSQHGSCHLSIIIKLAGRGRPDGRSEHNDSWPYNKDSFVCIDNAVEECYNLSHTELHCLRARERTRERIDRDGQRRTKRRTDRDMNGRTYITGTQEQLSFKLWNNTMPYRQRVGGGGNWSTAPVNMTGAQLNKPARSCSYLTSDLYTFP